MITGANRGIGKATAMKLAEAGSYVILVCRDPRRGEQTQAEIRLKTGNQQVDLLIADLSVQASIRRLAERFLKDYERLDVLINNHTAIFAQRELSADGIEMNFALNYLAYFHLTNLLLSALYASEAGRVISIASEIHHACNMNFTDLFFEEGYQPITAYCQAKLCNILFTYELARRTAGSHVTANCLDPGAIDTLALRTMRAIHQQRTGRKSADYSPAATPQEGAKTPFYLATSNEVDAVSGTYFLDERAVTSSEASYNQATAGHLWELSAEMVGLPD
jgi:NAD(P)-dependent dehydrogenase (short-subunit alcohol dehydrogenase family)